MESETLERVVMMLKGDEDFQSLAAEVFCAACNHKDDYSKVWKRLRPKDSTPHLLEALKRMAHCAKTKRREY